MKKKEILVLEDLLGSNKKIASEIRKKLTEKGILTINLLGSPGAGKTTLLERIAEHLKSDYKMAVIEGDIETERDAERIRAKGIPAWQIITGGACHLEAKMVGKILSVKLKVGKLSGVVPEFLKTAFDVYKKDTIAAEAKLEMKKIPVKIQCQKCHNEIIIYDFVFICTQCG